MSAMRPLAFAWLLTAALPLHTAAQAPAGATARCGDGSYSVSANRRGTCSHHGGVAQWLTPSQAPTRADSVSAAQAPAQQRTLTTAEAKDHVGEIATVCGVVASARYAASSRGQPTFLNLDQPYPSQVFTLVVWGADRGNFPESPESAYRGKRICVTGPIGVYRGTTQIVARSPTVVQLQH